ncbi:MAG: hypothetical protein IJ213_02720 [Bacteroidales bacterium]|nr:hypothetical protein [Bacteroidales bacterium]
MKKVLLVIFSAVLLLSNTNLLAQNREHLKFMGISMDMNVNSFVKKLKQKGLIYVKEDNKLIVLTGKFAGHNNCNIFIFPNSENKVQCCATYLTYRDDWKNLQTDYITIKNMLIKKYGKPMSDEEEWDGVKPTTDYEKMTAVRNGKCKYYTSFYVNGGLISMCISDVLGYGQVNLKYIDRLIDYIGKNNGKIDRENGIEDL